MCSASNVSSTVRSGVLGLQARQGDSLRWSSWANGSPDARFDKSGSSERTDQELRRRTLIWDGLSGLTNLAVSAHQGLHPRLSPCRAWSTEHRCTAPNPYPGRKREGLARNARVSKTTVHATNRVSCFTSILYSLHRSGESGQSSKLWPRRPDNYEPVAGGLKCLSRQRCGDSGIGVIAVTSSVVCTYAVVIRCAPG